MGKWENVALIASAMLFAAFFGHVFYAASTRAPLMNLTQEALLLGASVLCFAAGSLGREAREKRRD